MFSPKLGIFERKFFDKKRIFQHAKILGEGAIAPSTMTTLVVWPDTAMFCLLVLEMVLRHLIIIWRLTWPK